MWDLVADKCSTIITPTDSRDALRSVSMSGDGKRVVCASSKGDLYLYEMNKQELKLIKKIKAHNNYVLKALISPHAKQIATASADYTIKLWDLTKVSTIYVVITKKGFLVVSANLAWPQAMGVGHGL